MGNLYAPLQASHSLADWVKSHTTALKHCTVCSAYFLSPANALCTARTCLIILIMNRPFLAFPHTVALVGDVSYLPSLLADGYAPFPCSNLNLFPSSDFTSPPKDMWFYPTQKLHRMCSCHFYGDYICLILQVICVSVLASKRLGQCFLICSSWEAGTPVCIQ